MLKAYLRDRPPGDPNPDIGTRIYTLDDFNKDSKSTNNQTAQAVAD